MPKPIIAALLALVLVACGTRQGMVRPPQDPQAQRGPAAPARPVAPRPLGPSLAGKSFPECDPRAGDPDRGRAALGLLAADCQDDRGRNRAYVTRLVTVQGRPSPAGREGVEPGDRIVRIDACEVASTHQLAQQLGSAVPGWVARLVVERDGREREIFVNTVRLPGRGKSEPATLSTAGCPAIKRKPAQP